MTEQQIKKQQAQETLKFEIAAQIRRTLEEAKETYKRAGGKDLEDWESEILELVSD
jgi:hypothetical protein